MLSLLTGAPRLFAQANPTASRAGDLIVGAGYTSAESDYGYRFTGYGIYGDFNFYRNFGVEATFHSVKEGGNSPIYERTFEVGPRYSHTYGPFVPYLKIMIGHGSFRYPDDVRGTKGYGLYSGGFGTDIKVRPYLYLRGDFEYQKWYNFPPSSLSPQLFTFGAAYHFR